ncbi:nucleoside-diphosphate kinase [Novosphingobium sp. FSY-8]|uniref:Nucleoside-diphosphate kinase n=1 Tax=Novosphingobium ovatum TaxID=1908523 RepID=A0ABW9XDR8_9SPHN|nr:GreA/GreB family elongation factor [Novosphingobium ovatum]NBC36645.1 nucleoside-diphosphate kinase [Novosphingobium ovatum]
MSVAFRRDGDEEHLEPKFELPIPPGPNRVTPQGAAQTLARMAEFEALIPTLSDEAEITKARRQLRYWRTRAATMEPQPAPDGSEVAFGCTVDFTLNGRARSVTVVGDDQADPAAGMLAWSAPLVRAMMGAQVGDWCDFNGREEAIEITAIAPSYT